MEENSGGCKCMEEGGGVMVDRKISRKLKGKVVMSCVTLALPLQCGDGGTDRETTEAAGLREQLGQEDCRNEEGA